MSKYEKLSKAFNVTHAHDAGTLYVLALDALAALAQAEARALELEPEPITEAPMNGQPVRVWVETTDGSGAWFDARYLDGVWLESRIVHFNHGFVEKRVTVLRPRLFVPCTPRPAPDA